jgi:hypothetical protein
MNPAIKSVLLGLALGLFPIPACAFFYFVTPYLVEGNPGAVLSFAVIGLYFVSSIGVIVISFIFLSQKKTILGAVAIIVVIAQAAITLTLTS